MKHHLHLELDDSVVENIERLKKVFDVKTPGDVIRRCLAVANFATKQASTSDGIIVMRGANQSPEEEIRVLLTR